MNRRDVIDAIAARTDNSKVAIGESVGFGTVSLVQCAALAGRSSSTGAKIRIATAKAFKFVASKAFRDALNAS